MYYVYILKRPNDGPIYIGYTDDLKRRDKEHRGDKPGWKLIYYEAYFSKEDARAREEFLKHYGSSLGHLKNRIRNSLEAL